MHDFNLRKLLLGVIAFAVGLTFGSLRMSPQPPEDAWFQARVVESDRPVIVKFGADWCGPCRRVDQELRSIRSGYAGQLDVVFVDIDEKPHLARHYNVGSIPRLLLMKDGRVRRSRVGFASRQELLNWAHPFLDGPS